MALAGFTIGEAEGLRRAMSRKRTLEAIEAFRERFVEGAVARTASTAEVANAVYDKLVGFSGFGFPKSHAAAFGLLAYQSAWLRHHYPAEFLCALLNAQPMGFYPPVDARARRAAARGGGAPAGREPERGRVRPGGKARSASASATCARWATTRRRRSWRSGRGAAGSTGVRDLAQRAVSTGRGSRRSSPRAPATRSRAGDAALLWELGLAPRPQTVPGSGGEARQLALPLDPTAETPALPEQTVWERMLADYRTTSLSVGVHPLELLRPHLPDGTLSSRELRMSAPAGRVAVAGMAVARQRPATANGVVFMLLEDEFGQVNLIVPPRSTSGSGRSCAPSRSCSRAAASSVTSATATSLVRELVSPRPARAPLRRRRRRLRLTPRGAPLRPPLTSPLGRIGAVERIDGYAPIARLRARRRRPHRRPDRARRLDRLALPAERRLAVGVRPAARRRARRLVPPRADGAVRGRAPLRATDSNVLETTFRTAPGPVA